MNVYTKEVGSDTPTMRRGWPPIIDCRIPQIAVDVNVCTQCTAVITSYVSLSTCSPKAITGRAGAKNMYAVGA
ncbi:hypothetical protein M758_5G106800 [Ceratodon purpureus]|nr:hypothetical protein M758_5G106800 [Ceratodon purpureus]